MYRILELFVTNKCNARCSYCYIKKGSSEMSLQTMYKAFRRLYNFEPLEISFFGGEPLLAIETIKSFVEKVGILNNIKYSMATNGTYLTPSFLEFADKYKFLVSFSDGSPILTILNRGWCSFSSFSD